MSYVVGELAAPITGDPSKFNKALADTKRQGESWAKSMGITFGSVGKGMEDLGNDMSLKVTLPIIAAGAAAFNLGADFQDSIGATDQVFGSASQSMQRWTRDLESYYGIAESEALTYANTMGSMLQNIGGMTEEEAAKQSQTLIELAGDLTAMFGGRTEDAIRALTGALKGNNTMLDNYGMAVNDAMIKTKAMEMGLITEGKEMDLAAKQAATLALIMEQTGAAQGQAAREADGASGTMRGFTAELKNAGKEFGEVLLPTITPFIDKLRDLVRWFGALDDDTKRQIITWAAYAAATGPVLVGLGKVSKGIDSVLTFSGKLSKALTTTAKTAIPAATKGAAGLGSTFAGLSSAVGPIALTVTALAGLGTAFYILDSQVTEKTKSIEQQVKERFTEATEEAGRKIAEMNQAVSDEFEEMSGNVIEQLLNIKIGAKELSSETYQGVIDEVENMRIRALEILEQHKEEGIQALASFHEEAGTLNSEEYAQAYKNLQSHYAAETAEIETAYDNINMIIAEAMAEGRQVTQEEWDTILAILDGANNNVVDKERWLEGQLAAVFAEITEDSTEATKERADRVIDILKDHHQAELDEIAKQSDARIEEILAAYNRGEIATKEELDKQLELAFQNEFEKTQIAKAAHIERLEDQQWALDALGLIIDEGSGNLLTHWQNLWARTKEENTAWMEDMQRRTKEGYFGYGAAMAQGMGDGIKASEGYAVSAAEDLARAVNEKFNLSISKTPLPASTSDDLVKVPNISTPQPAKGGGNTIGSINNTVPINIHVHGNVTKDNLREIEGVAYRGANNGLQERGVGVSFQ